MNVCSILENNIAAGRADKVALLHGKAAWTYGALVGAANQMGNALRQLDVRVDDRVLLLMPDSAAFAICFFGAAKMGAVPVPVNTMLTPQNYEYVLKDSDAKVLIVDHTLYYLIEPVRANCKALRHVLVVGTQGRSLDGAISWEDCLEGESTALETVERAGNDMAFWLYSSGSTGTPKGVVHAHGSILSISEHCGKQVLKVHEDDICLSSSKLFHAYGLGNSIGYPFSAGATTVLNPNLSLPEVLLELIATFKPTLFFSIPKTYLSIAELVERGKSLDLGSLRLCISSGDALPAEIHRRWMSLCGIELLDALGSTELLHIFISNRPGAVKAGSSGRLVPGYQARVVDADGDVVPTGEIGDLIVAGPSVALGYWNQPDASSKVFKDGWVMTGDKYYVDEEGNYWYQGRSNDVFKSNGIWISPVEVESVLDEHPAVKECAVVSTQNQDGLLRAKAYVVLRARELATEELAKTLSKFVRRRLPQRSPQYIQFVEALPKTATGKIQRYKLRGDSLPPVECSGNSD
jgi:benzoate-CoA ligase family protein